MNDQVKTNSNDRFLSKLWTKVVLEHTCHNRGKWIFKNGVRSMMLPVTAETRLSMPRGLFSKESY